MPQFNTQSAASIPAGGSLLPTFTGNVGAYPILRASQDYNHPNILVAFTIIEPGGALNIMEGFIGDGDAIILPDSPSISIEYFDKDGNSIIDGEWGGGILPTDIDGSCDDWMGFRFDSVDDVIHVCAVDINTSPNTYFFASITQLGVITVIGSDQINFDFIVGAEWKSPQVSGASSLYRENDGSGNFIIRVNDGGLTTDEAQFSSVDGTQQGLLITATGSTGHYKTPNGNFVGLFQGDSADKDGCVINIGRENGSIALSVPNETNIPYGSNNGVFPMQWKGLIVFGGPSNNNNIFGCKASSVNDFNNFIDALANAAGL